jgi:hypothetical protein
VWKEDPLATMRFVTYCAIWQWIELTDQDIEEENDCKEEEDNHHEAKPYRTSFERILHWTVSARLSMSMRIKS